MLHTFVIFLVDGVHKLVLRWTVKARGGFIDLQGDSRLKRAFSQETWASFLKLSDNGNARIRVCNQQ
jgi:hypothetical protein